MVLDSTCNFVGRLASTCCSTADKVTHDQRCHGDLNEKVPVLYEGVDAAGSFVQKALDSIALSNSDEWERAVGRSNELPSNVSGKKQIKEPG